MSYTKLNFVSGEAPALSADNLNHMETGISDVHTALDNMDAGLVAYEPTWTEGYYVNASGELKSLANENYAYADVTLSAVANAAAYFVGIDYSDKSIITNACIGLAVAAISAGAAAATVLSR